MDSKSSLTNNYQHTSLLIPKTHYWACGAASQLTAVRSIARDFKKYKPVALLYDSFHDINQPLKAFYNYRTGRKLAPQAAGRNKFSVTWTRHQKYHIALIVSGEL
jgi:hypothetical protein